MKIYRLTEKKYADSIRFTRLRYYQMLELVCDDASIGDVEEGRSIAQGKGTISADSKAASSLAADHFIVVTGNTGAAGLNISGSTFSKEVDCFVFCWSTVMKPNLSGSGVSYDTCITSHGAKTLAHFFNTCGIEKESGRPLSELFHPLRSGRVKYYDLDHDLSDGPVPSGDPFRKRKRYSVQAEYRFALFPKKPMNQDFVFVECKEAAQLLSVSSIDGAVVSRDSAEESLDSYQKKLDDIVTKWRAMGDVLSAESRDRTFMLLRLGAKNVTQEQLNEEQARSSESYTVANKEFDRLYLKEVRLCLFKLRKPPFIERLDKALARGARCSTLLLMYTMPVDFQPNLDGYASQSS